MSALPLVYVCMRLIDKKNNFKVKFLHLFIATLVAIFTTGWMRVHLIPWGPEMDSGHYTFLAQYFYKMLPNISSEAPLSLYSLFTSWVYGFEINQWMALRWIDLCVAVIASIIFFKIIIKESASLPFAFIILIPTFLIMNDYVNIRYGFANGIWASYVPFFAALLISQNINKDSYYAFYFIGALAAFGVLLREPLLSYFIVGGVSILIGYGWKALLKYSVGAFLLGFSIVVPNLMLRGWDLFGFVDGYRYLGSYISYLALLESGKFFRSGLFMASEFWYGLILVFFSVFYIAKNFLLDNKINLGRFAFWLAIALVPMIEAYTKYTLAYHFAQCIPGFVGFIALTWKYLSSNESKKIQRYSITLIYLLCFLGAYPKLKIIYNNYNDERTLKNAYNQLWTDTWKNPETITASNYLIAADTIRQLSNKDSTLAMGGGYSSGLFPLTGLLPPTYRFHDLRSFYANLEFNEDLFVKHLKEHQPTIIMPTKQSIPGIKILTRAIQRTGLYELVAIVEYKPETEAYDISASIAGNIYRLKSFVKEDN